VKRAKQMHGSWQLAMSILDLVQRRAEAPGRARRGRTTCGSGALSGVRKGGTVSPTTCDRDGTVNGIGRVVVEEVCGRPSTCSDMRSRRDTTLVSGQEPMLP